VRDSERYIPSSRCKGRGQRFKHIGNSRCVFGGGRYECKRRLIFCEFLEVIEQFRISSPPVTCISRVDPRRDRVVPARPREENCGWPQRRPWNHRQTQNGAEFGLATATRPAQRLRHCPRISNVVACVRHRWIVQNWAFRHSIESGNVKCFFRWKPRGAPRGFRLSPRSCPRPPMCSARCAHA
jgi:hypothetical protein